MKIGIIGSGNVGGTLGKGWAAAGHTVVFSSRNPSSDEMRQLIETAGANSSAATLAETVAVCDILLLATPWPATQAILAGAGSLVGKVLIDAVNPVLPSLTELAVGTTTSAGELVAEWAPGAKVVKAFNTIGVNVMANPHFGEAGDSALFYCGDDAGAKAIVHQLAKDLGFEPKDSGPLRVARALEPMALLWISLAMMGGREMAFRFITR